MNRLSRLVTERLIERSDRQAIWRPSIGATYGGRDQRMARSFFSDKLTEEVGCWVSIDKVDHAFFVARGP